MHVDFIFKNLILLLVFNAKYSLLPQKTKDIPSINNEFLFGFVNFLDGEKDPRNLLLAFSLVPIINGKLDIKSHVEVLNFIMNILISVFEFFLKKMITNN